MPSEKNQEKLGYGAINLRSVFKIVDEETQTNDSTLVKSSSNSSKSFKLPLPRDLEKPEEGTIKVFSFCQIIQDPQCPTSVTIVRESITEEVHAHKECPEDTYSNRYRYCKEVIKPYLKDYPPDCPNTEDLLIRDAIDAANEEFPEYPPCYEVKDPNEKKCTEKEEKETTEKSERPKLKLCPGETIPKICIEITDPTICLALAKEECEKSQTDKFNEDSEKNCTKDDPIPPKRCAKDSPPPRSKFCPPNNDECCFCVLGPIEDPCPPLEDPCPPKEDICEEKKKTGKGLSKTEAVTKAPKPHAKIPQVVQKTKQPDYKPCPTTPKKDCGFTKPENKPRSPIPSKLDCFTSIQENSKCSVPKLPNSEQNVTKKYSEAMEKKEKPIKCHRTKSPEKPCGSISGLPVNRCPSMEACEKRKKSSCSDLAACQAALAKCQEEQLARKSCTTTHPGYLATENTSRLDACPSDYGKKTNVKAAHKETIATIKCAMEDFVCKIYKTTQDAVSCVATESVKQLEKLTKSGSKSDCPPPKKVNNNQSREKLRTFTLINVERYCKEEKPKRLHNPEKDDEGKKPSFLDQLVTKVDSAISIISDNINFDLPLSIKPPSFNDVSSKYDVPTPKDPPPPKQVENILSQGTSNMFTNIREKIVSMFSEDDDNNAGTSVKTSGTNSSVSSESDEDLINKMID